MAEPAPALPDADLTNCDREPIHIPGSIQPHGVLLAADPRSLKVVQIAGDTQLIVGLAPGEVLGHGLETLMGEAGLNRLKALSAQDVSMPRSMFIFGIEVQHRGEMLDAIIHQSGGVLVVELEPRLSEPPVKPLAVVQGMLTGVQNVPDMPGFLQAITEAVHAETGFDRVMVYKFLPDDSGEVIAEAKAEGLEPLLGLHYPASDIPKQARDLYLRNRSRVIPDARYAPALISPALNPLTGAPLDLTFSVLRSVSPLHLEYLANMGVAASMSLSIVIGGRLWGLIACHHRTPRYVAQAVRSACELFAQMISLQLSEKLANEAQRERLRMRKIHGELVEAMVGQDDLGDALIRAHPSLLDYIPAEGVAVWWQGKVARRGLTPTEDELGPLVEWLTSSAPDGVFMTDCLASHFAPAKDYAGVASGLLALSVSRTPRDYVLWFRPEVSKTVTWAGNPSKPVGFAEDGLRLSPRKSFAAWKEVVREHSRPWGEPVADAAQLLRLSILDVVLRHQDRVMREREQARLHQDFLMAELDHRVKNTLATIQSLVKYSATGTGSLEDFTRSIQERIRAMASAHSLLTQNRWKGVNLRNIVAEQSAPFGGADRVKITGPAIMLRPKAALSLSLALHELMTNAAKYGALSAAAGGVEISWRTQESNGKRWLLLRWSEHGGPRVATPSRMGFGRILLERSLAYDVDGEVHLDFNPEGLICTAMIPFEHIIEREE
jgi:light-regulated signal transduction histidine kinase (bacteriophytochrome)